MGGPCTAWVTVEDLQSLDGAQGIDADTLQTAIDVASGSLWRRSARQYTGVCHDVVRPLRRMYAVDGGSGGWGTLASGSFFWRDGGDV